MCGRLDIDDGCRLKSQKLLFCGAMRERVLNPALNTQNYLNSEHKNKRARIGTLGTPVTGTRASGECASGMSTGSVWQNDENLFHTSTIRSYYIDHRSSVLDLQLFSYSKWTPCMFWILYLPKGVI